MTQYSDCVTDEELIERLRLWNWEDAADRIETLTAQLDAARAGTKPTGERR